MRVPVLILDGYIKMLRTKEIPLVEMIVEPFTRGSDVEAEEEMQAKYPHLFDNWDLSFQKFRDRIF